jgi:hypothetical protein
MNLWKEAAKGRLISPFERYEEERCRWCIRAPICRKSEGGLILCAVSSLFKGAGDEFMLEQEERALLDSLEGEELKGESKDHTD